MKFQVAVTLFATSTPLVVGDYFLRPNLNQRVAELRNKERRLAESNALEATQTFFVPLPEATLFEETFRTINTRAEGPIESMISISISTDGSKVFYDHWEDGYEADPMHPVQESTQVWGDGDHTNGCKPEIECTAENAALDVFKAGESIVLEQTVPLDHHASSPFLYDGRDLIQSLYPVALTRGAFPADPGSLMAGAVEVFDTRYWGTEFKIPLDQNTSSDHDAFEYVGLYFMACDDGTVLSNAGGEIATLNKGEGYYMVAEAGSRGTTISASGKVQVHMVSGDNDSTYELRWFSLHPNSQWSNSYLSPVGDTEAMTKVVIYNGNDAAIDVAVQTADESYTVNVLPNEVAYTKMIKDDSACKLDSDEDFVAYSISDTAAGAGDKHDWGFPVMPSKMLTSMALVGWGYGCTQNECDYFGMTHARSVVWVAALTDASVYVDYENDDSWDEVHEISFLESVRISDPNGDKDLSGAIIWAVEPGTGPNGPQVAIAAAWGQYAGDAFGGDTDALDLGTVVVPFAPIVATKGVELVEDTGDNGMIGNGDTIKYIIEVVNVGPSDIGAGLITIEDNLSVDVYYIAGTTKYIDESDNVTPIPDDADGTPFPLDDGGSPSMATLPSRGIHHIEFQVQVADTPTSPRLTNEGTAKVWDNTVPFDNTVILVQQERNHELSACF